MSQKKNFYSHLRQYSTPLVLYSFIGFFLDFFDRWLLQTIGGSAEQGYYSVGYRLSALAFLFTSAMTPVLTREMALAQEHNDRNKLQSLFDRIEIFLFIAAATGAIIAMNTPNIILILGEEDYSGATIPIFLMAVYPIHQTFGQLSNSLFLATGQTKKYAILGLKLMIVGLPMTYFLVAPKDYFIPGLGLTASGLAIKMVFLQVINTNVFLFYNCQYLGDSFGRWLLIQLRVIIPLFIFAYLSKLLAEFSFQYFSSSIFFSKTLMVPIFRIIFSGFIFCILTLALLYLYPNVAGLKKDDIRLFLSKKAPKK